MVTSACHIQWCGTSLNEDFIAFVKNNGAFQLSSLLKLSIDKIKIHYSTIKSAYGTVSAKIAPRLKCYKNASRLNRYNFPTDNAIDFLFSTLHSEMV